MLKGLYILATDCYETIYGTVQQESISNLVDIYAPQQTKESIRNNLNLLREAEVIFSGWGGPEVDEEFLAAAPNLKAVFYGAGSIKGIVTEKFWEREIKITSAYKANAIPVAEYTLSQMLFCLKRGWELALNIERAEEYKEISPTDGKMPGAYGSTVGVVSLGMIGSYVCKLLQDFDVEVIAYDPYVSEAKADKLGVQLCSLEEVFKESDVVSLHTPWLEETEGMITGELFASMKQNASFINTARGAVVNQAEMIEVLQERTDIQTVLDVTYPEPPAEDSLLYKLPNVVLTPHIAGSHDRECRRMGDYMVEELKRYVNEEPLEWEINQKEAQILA